MKPKDPSKVRSKGASIAAVPLESAPSYDPFGSRDHGRQNMIRFQEYVETDSGETRMYSVEEVDRFFNRLKPRPLTVGGRYNETMPCRLSLSRTVRVPESATERVLITIPADELAHALLTAMRYQQHLSIISTETKYPFNAWRVATAYGENVQHTYDDTLVLAFPLVPEMNQVEGPVVPTGHHSLLTLPSGDEREAYLLPEHPPRPRKYNRFAAVLPRMARGSFLSSMRLYNDEVSGEFFTKEKQEHMRSFHPHAAQYMAVLEPSLPKHIKQTVLHIEGDGQKDLRLVKHGPIQHAIVAKLKAEERERIYALNEQMKSVVQAYNLSPIEPAVVVQAKHVDAATATLRRMYYDSLPPHYLEEGLVLSVAPYPCRADCPSGNPWKCTVCHGDAVHQTSFTISMQLNLVLYVPNETVGEVYFEELFREKVTTS
jgi:hypothetical protein